MDVCGKMKKGKQQTRKREKKKGGNRVKIKKIQRRKEWGKRIIKKKLIGPDGQRKLREKTMEYRRKQLKIRSEREGDYREKKEKLGKRLGK